MSVAIPIQKPEGLRDREVAGVIDEVARDVDEQPLGRPVVADLGMASGGYAELGERPVTLALDGVGGRLVMVGSLSGPLTELSAGDLYARGITASAAIGARIMRRPGLRPLERSALAAAAEGRLVPVVGQRFTLAAAVAAHQALASRSTTGRTVLRPSTPS